VPFVVLAFGCRLVYQFWAQPWTWRIQSWGAVALLVSMVLAAVSVAAPMGVYLLVIRKALRPGATWHVSGDGHAFVAAASPRFDGPSAIALGWFAAGIILTERVPNGDRMRLAHFGAATTVSMVLAVVVLIGALVLVSLDSPRLVLDADAITLRRVRGRLRIRWDELAPGGPTPPRRKSADLILHQAAPSPAGAVVSHKIPARRLHVDPAFLVHTIRCYVDCPDLRLGIGTQAELARLQTAFASHS
jgi:hypothetical protein